MVNIFKLAFFNHLVASTTAIALTTALIQPQNTYASGFDLDIATINFGIKIEKIFEKIKRSIDKGETSKIINYMFDIGKIAFGGRISRIKI